MEQIRIYCKNTKEYYLIDKGSNISELAFEVLGMKLENGQKILAALCDNVLRDLNYTIYNPETIEFISYSHSDGRRCYIRSICFVLQSAVRDIFPQKKLRIDYSLPSGLYCEIRENDNSTYLISEEEIESLKMKMNQLIASDIPFNKVRMSLNETIKIFSEQGYKEKVELVQSLGNFSYNIYLMGNEADSFHGTLVPSTSYLKIFDIKSFGEGFCLQFPMDGAGDSLLPLSKKSKIADALKEHSKWCASMKISSVGTLNKLILDGKAKGLINLSEARHERCYAAIADAIYAQRDRVKIVFIAGPSSSGKTSSSLRIAQQCKVLGLNPKVIELDNYFVDRDHTPKDENGDYDFESLYAMDLELLNKQLNQLLNGEEIEIPKFNFKSGSRVFDGNFMHLEENDILIMEGIHALNPEMVSGVDNSKIFRVYVSALTSLSIDENNNISTSDNRLLRRMVRDNRTRGIVPEETILRWKSVRRGENRNIFPFQENADVVFNSALLFELPMLKFYAEPLLRRIAPTSPAYSEALRLLKFLDYTIGLSPEEIKIIPPTSIMREFIGGQML